MSKEEITEPSSESDSTTRAISWDGAPSSNTGPIRNRRALLVGVNEFVDPAIASLNLCVNDVLALEKKLKSLGYTVSTLHDDASEEQHKPRCNNVHRRPRPIFHCHCPTPRRLSRDREDTPPSRGGVRVSDRKADRDREGLITRYRPNSCQASHIAIKFSGGTSA